MLEREGAGPGGSLVVLLGCGIMGAPSALWEGVAASLPTKTDPERSEAAPEGRPVCRKQNNKREEGAERKRRKEIGQERVNMCVGRFTSIIKNVKKDRLYFNYFTQYTKRFNSIHEIVLGVVYRLK